MIATIFPFWQSSCSVKAMSPFPADAVPLPLLTGEPPERASRFGVRSKFTLAMILSLAWFALTTWLAWPWLRDLAALTNWPVAVLIVGGVALVPGLMNTFLAVSLQLDQRPPRRAFAHYPGVTILVAAFNEAQLIRETLESIGRQSYPGELEILVIDDGSTDGTAAIVNAQGHPTAVKNEP